MKRILVTGGSGFLGNALCKRLTDYGNEVISLDRISSKICNSILHDVIDPLPKIKVDEIYNLAGTPSPAKYLKDPIHTAKTNNIGTINVLELARSCNAKILQASTGEVYEGSNFIDSRACYRQGKKMAESLFFDYHRYYGVDIRVVRMFNSYGPGMSLDDGRVVPVFIQKALKNENIEVMGSGRQTRTFCYVDDMIEALILIMGSNTTKPIDASGLDEISVYDLAFKIINLAKSKSRIVFKHAVESDLAQKERGENVLDWRRETDLNEGLKKTIKYFRGEI